MRFRTRLAVKDVPHILCDAEEPRGGAERVIQIVLIALRKPYIIVVMSSLTVLLDSLTMLHIPINAVFD
jgi:hypothetical protein